jgi:hypothetical protein
MSQRCQSCDQELPRAKRFCSRRCRQAWLDYMTRREDLWFSAFYDYSDFDPEDAVYGEYERIPYSDIKSVYGNLDLAKYGRDL